MTDTTLNRFLASGTAAERGAFTPAPATPASGPDPSYRWIETDTGLEYAWDFDGAAWIKVNGAPTESFVIPCSDETTALVAGTALAKFRMPYAFTVTAVRASLTGAATTGTITVDINEGGTTIMAVTKLTIDATEKTSTTAVVPAVVSDAALADDAEMSFDLDDDADGTATGLKVTLIGHR